MISPFKVQFSVDEINEYLDSAKDILRRGGLIPGKYNQILEKMFAKFIGTDYAVTTITGTTALEIIYRCLDLKGKDVLVPANTNYATAEAAIRAGANVVLYDSALYPDFNSIKSVVSKKTRALVIVHIGGYITPNIEKIIAFCKEKNIYLIEDASHAHGSTYKKRKAGTFGIASAFSMFATKIVTTSEGGIIVSNNEKIKKLSTIYRDQGKDEEGIRNIVFGSAWRMSELHAAFGIIQIKRLKDYLRHNNKIIQFYKKHIITSAIDIPYNEDSFYSGYKFILLLKNKLERDSLAAYLLKKGIKVGKNVYDVPLHRQPALLFLKKYSYPKAEHFANTHICLPIWKGMKDEEMRRVVLETNSWSRDHA